MSSFANEARNNLEDVVASWRGYAAALALDGRPLSGADSVSWRLIAIGLLDLLAPDDALRVDVEEALSRYFPSDLGRESEHEDIAQS